jgi:hypothetical protein
MATVVTGFDMPACLRAAAAVEAGLLQLTSSLTEAEFHAPARGGGWSMGQCVEHLVLAGHSFLPRWDAALKQAEQLAANHSAKTSYSWWQRQLLRAMEDPSRLKLRSVPALVPYGRHSIEETVLRFRHMHEELVRRIEQTGGLDVRRTSIQSPLVSWMSHALGFSFEIALAHERRHIRQALRARQQLLGEAKEIVRYDT